MNILHTETLKHWGGQQNRVLREAVGLTGRGHMVVIACHKGSMLSERAKEAGIKAYQVSMTKGSYFLTVPRLVSIIKREKIDIVCTHSSIDSWAGGIASLITRKILVRFKHNLYRVKKDPPTRFIYSLPRKFITVNETAVEVLLKAGYIKSEKVKRVYGAIDPEKFNPAKIVMDSKMDLRRSLGIPEGALIIGNTSGFTEVKGQRYLLKAANELFRRYDNLYLLLAGRLGRKEKVYDHIKPEFHERIVLPGLIRDIPPLLSIMDIFVFPSTVEAFGNSLIEAMSMAKPVVVSDIPSFKEFISHGINGLFFRCADVESLTSNISNLITDHKRMKVLGENARETVIEKFRTERMLDEIEGVYLDLMKGNC